MTIRKMFGGLLMVAISAQALLAACETPPTPAPASEPIATVTVTSQTPKVTPTTTMPLLQLLEDRRFEEFGNAIGTGIVPPDMSAYRNNPSAALGAFFAKVVREGASCFSRDPDDFELRRVSGPAANSECIPVTSGPEYFVERIVQGGANAGISYLVGSAGLDGKYAFEFHITNPLTAVYPSHSTCVNIEKVVQIPPFPRTCDVYFVTGAKLTAVTYRQYVEVTVDAKYNSVINIEGKAYGSSTSMQSLQLLTVDFIRYGNHFDHEDTTGFLVPKTPIAAVEVANAVESQDPAIFLRLAELPVVDQEFILPQVSAANIESFIKIPGNVISVSP